MLGFDSTLNDVHIMALSEQRVFKVMSVRRLLSSLPTLFCRNLLTPFFSSICSLLWILVDICICPSANLLLIIFLGLGGLPYFAEIY